MGLLLHVMVVAGEGKLRNVFLSVYVIREFAFWPSLLLHTYPRGM